MLISSEQQQARVYYFTHRAKDRGGAEWRLIISHRIDHSSRRGSFGTKWDKAYFVFLFHLFPKIPSNPVGCDIVETICGEPVAYSYIRVLRYKFLLKLIVFTLLTWIYEYGPPTPIIGAGYSTVVKYTNQLSSCICLRNQGWLDPHPHPQPYFVGEIN